jgi:hypothetical protein
MRAARSGHRSGPTVGPVQRVLRELPGIATISSMIIPIRYALVPVEGEIILWDYTGDLAQGSVQPWELLAQGPAGIILHYPLPGL